MDRPTVVDSAYWKERISEYLGGRHCMLWGDNSRVYVGDSVVNTDGSVRYNLLCGPSEITNDMKRDVRRKLGSNCELKHQKQPKFNTIRGVMISEWTTWIEVKERSGVDWMAINPLNWMPMVKDMRNWEVCLFLLAIIGLVFSVVRLYYHWEGLESPWHYMVADLSQVKWSHLSNFRWTASQSTTDPS